MYEWHPVKPPYRKDLNEALLFLRMATYRCPSPQEETPMTTMNVPTRDEVAPSNQQIFDQLKGKLRFVPNLYATLAHSKHALGNYLAFQNAKSSITVKAREVINLAVSQVNECDYCLAAHTVIGGMVGFTPDRILEIRSGRASFDAKLDELARLVRDLTERRRRLDPSDALAALRSPGKPKAA